MSQGPSILLIDDEAQIRKFLRIALSAQGYRVLEAANGEDGLAQAALHNPDLVVLDLGLPDLDGQQVLRGLREWSQVPVLVWSVRASEVQKVEALDGGAKDYVTKPFGIQEFLARVRVLLRQGQGREALPASIVCGALNIDLAYRRVTLDDAEIALTPKEYQLLHELLSPPGRVMTRDQLMQLLYGWSEEAESNTLEVHIHHLRKKFSTDLIRTIRGVGYLVEERR